MRRHYTSEERSALVDLVTAGRATVSEAAARLGVTASTAYNWMSRAGATVMGRRRRRAGAARTRMVSEATFVRVVPSDAVEAAIAVRVGAAEIQLRRGFDAELLRTVVEALGVGGA